MFLQTTDTLLRAGYTYVSLGFNSSVIKLWFRYKTHLVMVREILFHGNILAGNAEMS